MSIIQSVLSGAWELNDRLDTNIASSCYFGLSTGVVDVRIKDIDYRTDKMLAFFKNSIVNGSYSPFMGEIRTNTGAVFHADSNKQVGVSLKHESFTVQEILKMDWLNENIDEI